MRILLDSGVTINKNVGDNAILAKTREALLRKGHQVETIDADSWNFLPKLVCCELYWICCGGLFKHTGEYFILRKLLTTFCARILRKKIYINSQTIFLKGIWRALFKIVFRGLTVNCRDKYSLKECKKLGLRCFYRSDVMIAPKLLPRIENLVVVDSRYTYMESSLKDAVSSLLTTFEKEGKLILEVPTIHTDIDFEIIQWLFGVAEVTVCVSFHGAVFSTNGGAQTICFYNNEYYRRKLSVLENTLKIPMRKRISK